MYFAALQSEIAIPVRNTSLTSISGPLRKPARRRWRRRAATCSPIRKIDCESTTCSAYGRCTASAARGVASAPASSAPSRSAVWVVSPWVRRSPARCADRRRAGGRRDRLRLAQGDRGPASRRRGGVHRRGPVDPPDSGDAERLTDQRPQRSASGETFAASASSPRRLCGCSGASGWRTASEAMTPPSFITTFVARNPHCRFS